MKARRWVWGLVVGSVAVPFLLGGSWLYRKGEPYLEAASTLPAELAAARREHVPLTPRDLARVPPVPVEQNAAPLYQQIDRALRANPIPRNVELSLIEVAAGKGTEKDRRAVRQILSRYAPQIHLAEQAAALPDCDFQRNWSLGPDLQIPEYATMRQIARLLAARAALQSEAGDPRGALQTLAIGGHIAQHAGKDPCLIAMLVQTALEAIMDRPFQRIIKQYADRPDVLRLAAHTDQAFGPLPESTYAFRSEVIMDEVVMDRLRRDPSEIAALSSDWRLAPHAIQKSHVDAWEARALSYWRRVFAVLRRANGDPLAEYRGLKALEDEEDRQAETVKATYELKVILMPVFSQACLKIARTEAQRRLRHEMLALFAYRQRTGRFPGALSELSPALPADPFDGQPLRYRATANGFVLYSIGENLVDDGGNATPKKKGDPPPDIVVAYP